MYTLIDGQQRMTTLFILLSVVREHAAGKKEKWDSLGDEIHKTCLINEFRKGDEHQKLMPTQGDRTPFARVISGETSHSGTQIEKGAAVFRQAGRVR